MAKFGDHVDSLPGPQLTALLARRSQPWLISPLRRQLTWRAGRRHLLEAWDCFEHSALAWLEQQFSASRYRHARTSQEGAQLKARLRNAHRERTPSLERAPSAREAFRSR